MKNLNKLLIIIFISLGMGACDDFLTTVPESTYVVDLSYKTQDDFNFAIAGVYAQQQELYRSNSCWFRAIIARSDDTRGGGTYLSGLDLFTDDADVEPLRGAWPRFWIIITRCNFILDKIDKIEFNDNNLKNYIKGEAYALRAWSYYTLGWQFGGMPLIQSELTIDEIKSIPRSSQDETFDFAISDFQKAIDLLPESWSGKNTGRVTKYAAMGGLARLHMFRSNFASAKPLLKGIIDSGKYAMEEDYINCFTDSHDNGKERVWEIQFSGGLTGEGQYLSTGMIPEGYTDGIIQPFAGFSTAMFVSLDMMNAYEEGDLRKDISTVSNLKVNGVVQDKYAYILKWNHFDTYTPQTQQDWANNIPILRYTDVKMMYAEVLNEEVYSGTGEAFSILNEVRKRAGLPTYTSEDLPNQIAFREALQKERRVEFAFEGLRWNDLVRWGIAEEVINEYFMSEDEGEGRYSMDGEYREIFAIPYTELSRYNDESIMWQNPGY